MFQTPSDIISDRRYASVLLELQQRLEHSLQEKTEAIAAHQKYINTAYDEINREEGAYKLHAICVHDGSADHGHYFALIKDHCLNKWRKISDINIRFIEESEVFEMASGGHGYMTAFWVFYIH